MEKKNSIISSEINIESLCQNSIELIQYARQIAAKQVNLVQLMTYSGTTGRYLVCVKASDFEMGVRVWLS